MFDVYVEGATGTSPGAVRELANTMAARYGVPAADVYARLTRGRFRVKADIDRATAETYQRDLESIGARVRIEPSTRPRTTGTTLPIDGARGARSSLPPQPAGRPSRSSLPPQPPARPSRSSLSPQAEARPRASDSVPPPIATTLGALDRSGVLSLATLDDEPATLSLTDGTMPASMGPRVIDPGAPAVRPEGPAAPRSSPPPRSRNEPIDPFAPPGAQPFTPPLAPPAARDEALDRFAPPELASADALVELADDELAYRARKRASVPPAFAAEAPRMAEAPSRRREPALPPDIAGRRPSLSTPPDELRLAAPRSAVGGSALPAVEVETPARGAAIAAPATRARFAAGVVLAIVVGFLPAHFVAAWRERSAFAAIDDQVASVQAAADNLERYAALDAFRAAQLDAKRSARRRIALTSLAIWAAAGGALAFGWFRRWR